ncbi:MAG: YicC/YloC family endoribonuclease [Candidatus Omnitrophota bacterium]
MIKSMTGFGRREARVEPFGKIQVELRSINHKFLDIVLHLPEGFLSLEERVKKEIESRVKRGRITCVVSISGARANSVVINKKLLGNYLLALAEIKKKFRLKNNISLESLIQLPGVLGLEESPLSYEKIWPHLRVLLAASLDNMSAMRRREGAALYRHLKNRATTVSGYLDSIRAHFKKAVKRRLERLPSDEERSSFLRDSDIAEEIERLAFHVSSFKSKIAKNGSIGKELDFISQEMQREANTMGAKSCDKIISQKAVQIKSQVEKIREQLQNVE